MIPSNTARVTQHTSDAVNRRIQMEIEKSVRWHGAHSQEIGSRLQALDREWDIERVLETNASALAFSGLMLGMTTDRRWLALPALVTGFLFQHAIQGWCPPVPVLRRLGFRTAREIETERVALKALRGDFGRLGDEGDKSAAALQAARA